MSTGNSGCANSVTTIAREKAGDDNVSWNQVVSDVAVAKCNQGIGTTFLNHNGPNSVPTGMDYNVTSPFDTSPNKSSGLSTPATTNEFVAVTNVPMTHKPNLDTPSKSWKRHDPGKDQSPPQIDHNCCYECGDSLDGIFCQQCTCKSCGRSAHYGYNCPSKTPIISNPEPCNQTINELPQTLPSFDPTCYSEGKNSLTCVSKPDFVNDSPNVFNPPPLPPTDSYEFCGNDAYYGYDCPPQVPFIYPEPCYNQDFNFPQNFQIQPPQSPVIHQPPQEASEKILQAKENLMNSVETYLKKFNRISFRETPKVLSLAWEKFFEINQKEKQHPPKDTQDLLRKLLEDVLNINEELAEYINAPSWNRPAFYFNDDDDEEYSFAITPDLPTEKPVDSLIMEDEHLDIIPATKSDELIKSSVKNLVQNPSGSEDSSDGECDLPPYDDSPKNHDLVFSNPLFKIDEDFTSSDESFSEEDVPNENFKIFSNPLLELDEEIISTKVDQIDDEVLENTNSIPSGIEYPCFNVESDLLQSLLYRDTSINDSQKIDSLVEFAGSYLFLESLLYDNSSPRPPEEFNSKNPTESFSPSPIPIKDSDSLMEEIDIFCDGDDSIPPGIESDDFDSESADNSTSLPEFESFHVDFPNSGDSTINVVEDIPIDVPNILPTHPTLHMDFDFIPLAGVSLNQNAPCWESSSFRDSNGVNRPLASIHDSLKIDNVEHVDDLRFNLLSIGQICDNKCRVTFSEHDSEITKNGEVIGIRKKGLYLMKLGNKPQDKICLATIDENSILWHRRLGHANMRLIQSLESKKLVRNLPKLKFNQHFCNACKIRKQAHASHKAKNIVSTTRCLELLHMDLFGPSAVRSYEENLYTLVIVDDSSRYTWTRFLKNKTEAFEQFEIFSRKIQNQLGFPIVSIRTDHGREFDNEVQFREFCNANGITHNFSAPCTPQSNGMVERKNRTLQEMSRTMLNEQSLPQNFWCNAVDTST
ncbi:retrovirus-related pol polyprotein from transposon TNT 1-94 [Tanacetum coccineum]